MSDEGVPAEPADPGPPSGGSSGGSQADRADDDLVAFLDGELAGRDAQRVAARLSLDRHAREEADQFRKTWALLDHLPRAEPSADFTSRTIDRLAVLASATPAAGGSPPELPPDGGPGPEPAAPAASPPRAPRPGEARRVAALLLWAAALVLSAAAGYWAAGPAVADRLAPADRRVAERFRLYRHVDDLLFLRALDDPELFGDGAPR